MVDIKELNHKATNSFGTPLRGDFIPDERDENIIYLHEKNTGKVVGYIDFQVIASKKTIFINDMENYLRKGAHPYKGIGNLLHELIFFTIAKENLVDYSIQLTVAHQSHIFHYMNGFRFVDARKNTEMEMLLLQGKAAYTNLENLNRFPSSMVMPRETILARVNYYKKTPGESKEESKKSSVELSENKSRAPQPPSNPTGTVEDAEVRESKLPRTR